MSTNTPCELDLIDWIRRHSQEFPSSVIKHIGDDCAVFDLRHKSHLAVTTDMLLEDIHFRRRWTSPYFLGRKTLLVNLSDLAAVGAQPYACLLSLALPADLTQEYFHSFMKGFLEEGSRWAVPLIGGDLSQSATIVVSVTVWGCFETGIPIWRCSAQDKDLLVLIGEIGFSRLGLEILESEDPRELSTIESEDLLADWAGEDFRHHCLKAHLLPHPLVHTGVWLSENHVVNAMIDISDGLASDLLQIARQSQLTAEIQVDHLPLPERGLGQVTALEAALDGGEDYALLFTASQEQLDRLISTYLPDFPPYQVIGHLWQGEPGVYLKQSGKRKKYQPRGFDHFG
ncbi:thiamine-phosphate kinase [Acidobacteria bacterium AH-259-D05]|nr:thiamine-phosphate kinase [Acidobacteria bacterium AH-259-D05]